MKRMAWPKLFHRSRAADAAAAEFEGLLRQHVPAFYRCAYRWTGHHEGAEDLVQELLVRLYPRLAELRTLDRPRPWAMRVMYRIFVDQLRRERSSPVQFGTEGPGDASDGDEEIERADDSEDPIRLLEQQLTQERILAAWTQLTDEHRVVLSMHDIEGYTLTELSPIMEVPLGTLKSRLHRARARLRELLAAERFSVTDRV
jgi:RNA polymerase sigma-70 factor (ECF subfamily)